MIKLFLPVLAISLILSLSNTVLSQNNDATENDANVTETKTEVSGEICPVSGETIGEGEGVVFNYMGTEYKFCCKNCLKKFKSEPMDYIKGELKCPVTGESASKDEYAVIDNVKYYFCCSGCKSKFEKEPEKYLNKENKDK